jgi:hypothetical protein
MEITKELPMYGLTADSLNTYKDELTADAKAHPGTIEASYDNDMIQGIELQQAGQGNSLAAQLLHQDEWNLLCQDPNCGINAGPVDCQWVRLS